jgi:hypothetical protein
MVVTLALLSGCLVEEHSYLLYPETLDEPLPLDQPSSLGFTAQEVLARVGTTTYAATAIPDEPAGWDDVQELVHHAPFEISTDATAAQAWDRTKRQQGLEDRTSVWILVPYSVRSADGAISVDGLAGINATAVDDASIRWSIPDTLHTATGVLPAWTEGAAERALERSLCEPVTIDWRDGRRSVSVSGPLNELRMTVLVSWHTLGECASALTLDRVELQVLAP